jgi:TolA-binding protein
MLGKLDAAGVKAGDAFLSLIERSVFYLALSRFNQDRFGDAQKTFEQLLARYPDSPLRDESRFRLAQTLFRQESFARAAEQYEPVAAGTGEFAGAAAFERSLSLYKAGKLKEASAAFASMGERFPEHPQAARARLYAGTFLFEAGDYQGALERLEAIARGRKEMADEAAYWAGMSLLKLGDHARAEKAFADALETFRKSPMAGDMRLGLADARLAQDKFEPAAEAFRLYAADFPKSEQAPRALYSACVALHRADKYAESDDLCGRFLAQFAANELAPQAQFLSGENRFLLKRYDRAAERYGEYLQHADRKSGDLTARAHYRMAWVYRYTKRVQDALAELQKIDPRTAGEPIATEMKYLEGACWFESEQYAKAIKSLTAYLEARDHARFGDDALLKLSVAEMKQDRKPRAAASLERFLKEYPQSELLPQVQYQLAECYYDQKNYAKASGLYALLAAREKGDDLTPFALFGTGLCAFDQEHWAEAAQAFTELAQTFPKSELAPQALHRKARSLMKLKQWPEAGQTARALLTAYPKHELARAAAVMVGTCLQEQQKWADAAAAFRAVVDDYPAADDQARILYEQAWSWQQAGKEEESLKAFRQLADRFPADPLAADAYFYMGEARYRDRQEPGTPEPAKQRDARLADARALYGKCLDVAKDQRLTDKARYRIGWCYWLAGEYARAAAEFDRLLKDFPATDLFADAAFQAGQAYAKAGQPAAAVDRFNRLIGDKRSAACEFLPDAYLALANCLLILDRPADAMPPLETVIARYKEERVVTQAHFLMGKAAFNLKQYDPALEHFQEVTRRTKSETGAEAQFYIGQVQHARNDLQAAVVAYLRVIALYRDHPEWVAAAMFESAKCHEALGDKAQAKQLYETIVKDYGNTKWAKPAAERL